jgi:hypothetical protein
MDLIKCKRVHFSIEINSSKLTFSHIFLANEASFFFNKDAIVWLDGADWTAPVSHPPFWRMHLRRCMTYPPIEIGLEPTPFVVLVNFFPHLKMQKIC